jgi:hypothetical protein
VIQILIPTVSDFKIIIGQLEEVFQEWPDVKELNITPNYQLGGLSPTFGTGFNRMHIIQYSCTYKQKVNCLKYEPNVDQELKRLRELINKCTVIDINLRLYNKK